MNSYLKYTAIALIFITSSCEDFLDNPPLGGQTIETFFTNESEAEKGLMAAYYWLSGDDWYYKDVSYTFGDVMSDNSFVGWWDLPDWTRIGEFEITSLNGHIGDNWIYTYKGIFNANLVIERVPLSPEIDDEAFINKVVAEAKALRAYQYYGLARMFGGVILLDHPSTEADGKLERSTLEETWDFIEQDLIDAIPYLPKKSEQATEEQGRITEGMARALLSKVYVYREKWPEALEMAESVISTEEYALEPLEVVWDNSIRNCRESIFELQTSNDIAYWLGSTFALMTLSRNSSNAIESGWGFNTPTSHLDNAYIGKDGVTEDPRRPFTIIRHGEGRDENGNLDPAAPAYNVFEDGVPDTEENPSARISRKMFSSNEVRNGWSSDVGNYKYIRYADLLLLAAEAAYHEGDEGKARQYANLVRMRAWDNKDSEQIVSSGTALLDELYLERRLEMAMEGERFYDLRRTGKLTEALSDFVEYNMKFNTDFDAKNNKGELFDPDKHTLFPIPQSQMDLSEGEGVMLEQNPNY
jgi:hypothetical protein